MWEFIFSMIKNKLKNSYTRVYLIIYNLIRLYNDNNLNPFNLQLFRFLQIKISATT